MLLGLNSGSYDSGWGFGDGDNDAECGASLGETAFRIVVELPVQLLSDDYSLYEFEFSSDYETDTLYMVVAFCVRKLDMLAAPLHGKLPPRVLVRSTSTQPTDIVLLVEQHCNVRLVLNHIYSAQESPYNFFWSAISHYLAHKLCDLDGWQRFDTDLQRGGCVGHPTVVADDGGGTFWEVVIIRNTTAGDAAGIGILEVGVIHYRVRYGLGQGGECLTVNGGEHAIFLGPCRIRQHVSERDLKDSYKTFIPLTVESFSEYWSLRWGRSDVRSDGKAVGLAFQSADGTEKRAVPNLPTALCSCRDAVPGRSRRLATSVRDSLVASLRQMLPNAVPQLAPPVTSGAGTFSTSMFRSATELLSELRGTPTPVTASMDIDDEDSLDLSDDASGSAVSLSLTPP